MSASNGSPLGAAWSTADATGGRAPTNRTFLATVGALISVVALYVWDDALFAAPIVAGTRWLGAWTAFIVFALVYGVASFVVALLAVREYDRRSAGRGNRLALWVERESRNQRASWIRGLLTSGRIVGFVLASFMIGGVVTTFVVRLSGRREGLTRLAAASSTIFSVTFVGLYSGVGHAIFGQ